MIYQQITPEYYDQTKQLVYKSFAYNTHIPKILDVSDEEVRLYRYQYVKFVNNNAFIALEEQSCKVVGVTFTEDLIDSAQSICNEKIIFSQGFQFMRQKILKVIFQDYMKNHPNIKRGEVAYNYSGCVDYQYRNQNILTNIYKRLMQYNKECGFKTVVGYTTQQRVMNSVYKAEKLYHHIVVHHYPFKNLQFRGRIFDFPSWLLQFSTQIQPKL